MFNTVVRACKSIWAPRGARCICCLTQLPEPKGASRAGVGDTPIGKDRGDEMFMTLFVVLLVAWLLGWGAFHVAGGLIHLLLLVAVISLIVHFIRGRGATV